MSVPEPDPRPLVLCVDGSVHARAAAQRGGELLAATSAVAVSAWLPAPTFRHGPLADAAEALLEPAGEVDAVSERAAHAAAEEVAGAVRAGGTACEAEAVRVERSTWRTLLDVAEDRDAAVVVTGAHGASGSQTNVIGSVAMALVHHAPRPVLVVPPGAQGAGPVLLARATPWHGAPGNATRRRSSSAPTGAGRSGGRCSAACRVAWRTIRPFRCSWSPDLRVPRSAKPESHPTTAGPRAMTMGRRDRDRRSDAVTHPIIAAIDPHRPDDAPLSLAARLGRLTGAPVIVAGVVADDGIASAVPTPEWQRMALEHAQGVLDEAVARVDAGIPVETHPVVSSSAPRGLHGLAIKTEAGALVAGASHRGPVGRIVPGSMTERLLLGAPCPVAVAPRETVPPGRRIARIGVAYDGSGEAHAALSVAQRLAERAGGSVRVLTVMEPAESAGAIWPGPNWAFTLDPERTRRIARSRLDEALEALPAGVRDGGEVLHGKAAEQLAEAGAALDLLVCGSRGYGPARAILLGSVSHGLAHRARCPLLVLPHDAGEALASLLAPAAEATAG